MSKSNSEIVDSFLSLNSADLKDSNNDILKELSSVVDVYLSGETEDSLNSRIETILTEDNSHAEYLRDLIADAYFEKDSSDEIKSKIMLLSNSNSLLSNELEFRADLKKLYLIEQRPILKKKLQELTEPFTFEEEGEVAAAMANYEQVANASSEVSFLKPLAIAASVLLVVFVGYFIFKSPQQIPMAKIEYKRIPIAVDGLSEHQGFADGDGQLSNNDTCVLAVINDSINAYRFWNDTLILKTNINLDSIQVIRKITNDSNKIFLKLNADEYQIMESEEYLKISSKD